MSDFSYSTDTRTTAIYPLSLHDALPIYGELACPEFIQNVVAPGTRSNNVPIMRDNFVVLTCMMGTLLLRVPGRSEEHTSELQPHHDLVYRLLLDKQNRRKHRMKGISELP